MEWFRESDFSDNEKPALFVQCVKQTMCKFTCCEFSKSQLEIECLNKDNEQFLSKSEIILERGLKHMLEENIPRDEGEKLILFMRLWRRFLSLTGHCFSCNFDIECNDEFTCDICLTDNIVLNEAIHFEGFWNNIGDYTFFSDPLPTITTRNTSTENNQNLDFMTCILICKRNEGIPFCPFSNLSKNESEGLTTITWKSMTIPRHYFLIENFWECTKRNEGSTTSDQHVLPRNFVQPVQLQVGSISPSHTHSE